MNPCYALIPLAGLVAAAAIIWFACRRTGEGMRRADAFWALPQLLVLLALIALGAKGWLATGKISLVAATAAAVAGVAAAFLRPGEPDECGAHGEPDAKKNLGVGARAAVTALGIAVTSVLGMLALELPWNQNPLPTDSLGMVVELGFICAMLLCLWLLCGRHAGGAAAGLIALMVVGLVQYFVIVLKAQPLMPSDLLAVGTAAAVGGGYDYLLPASAAWAIVCTCIGVGVLSLLPVPRRTGLDTRARALRAAGNIAGGLAVVAALFLGYSTVSLKDSTHLLMDYWSTETLYVCYCNQGFVPTFIVGLQDFPIPMPDGYSDEAVAATEAEWAARFDDDAPERTAARQQFDEVKPSVVVVMNETFADLSSYYGDLGCGYQGLAFFGSEIAGTVQRGQLTVPVLGGGTANTEFEFLTGNSCAFVGFGKHPYAIYDLSSASDGIVKQLGSLGYQTTAIHPNLAVNWSRDRAYASLGFDQFLDIDSFEGAPVLHSGVTDGATYQKVLELLRSSDQPQFIFDVTMQNHSGYNLGNLPAEYQLGLTIPGLDADANSQTNEYLGCIKASDEDLAAFVQELSKLDRPVVLVFFGDHQPSVSPSLNELTHPEDAGTPAHQHREYQTPYLIWANYDVAGSGDSTVQANAYPGGLSALTLSLIGAPLTGRQQATLSIARDIPALNCFGYLGADGVWHSLDDMAAPYADELNDLRSIQYLNFAERVQ